MVEMSRHALERWAERFPNQARHGRPPLEYLAEAVKIHGKKAAKVRGADPEHRHCRDTDLYLWRERMVFVLARETQVVITVYPYTPDNPYRPNHWRAKGKYGKCAKRADNAA